MAFKLKSGNASAFKNLGSSPAKQVEGNFNKTGGKSTTPGYSTTKAAKAAEAKNLKKNFDAFQSQKQKGKEFVKNLKTKGNLPNAKTNMKIDLNLENKKALNQKLGKVKKPTEVFKATKAFKNKRYIKPNVVKNITKIAKTGLRLGRSVKNLSIPGALGEAAYQGAKFVGKSWDKAKNIDMNDSKYAEYAKWKHGTSGKSKNKGKSTEIKKGDKIKAIGPKD